MALSLPSGREPGNRVTPTCYDDAGRHLLASVSHGPDDVRVVLRACLSDLSPEGARQHAERLLSVIVARHPDASAWSVDVYDDDGVPILLLQWTPGGVR
ncbi:MAG: hypothetical protein JNK49_21515 [Planctomycetes bacterium]|nr:hypothetical protein [Planctomycetota bacterium]